MKLILTVPKQRGEHKAKFSLATGSGKTFGTAFWVKVNVLPPEYIPDAMFRADITVPDGAYVFPNETIRKKWLLSNPYGPKKPWPEGVQLLKISQHRGGREINLNGERAVGSEIKQRSRSEYLVTTDFTVPPDVKEGKIRQKYRLATAEGKSFGHSMWIEVEVNENVRPFPGLKVIAKPADVTEADAGNQIGTHTYRLLNSSTRSWQKFRVYTPPSLFFSSHADKGSFVPNDREFGPVKANESIQFSFKLPEAPKVTCKFEHACFIRSVCGKYLSDLPTTTVSVQAPMTGNQHGSIHQIEDEIDDVVHIDPVNPE